MFLKSYRLVSVPVPFRLSWGKPGYSRHVFVVIADEQGRQGVGEGVLYKTTHWQLLPFLEAGFPLEPAELLSFEPGLAFAVDTAIRDIQGKINQADYSYPVIREIFLEEKNLENKVCEYVAKGTKIIKLKVGLGVNKDKDIITRVNRAAKGQVKINLDANRAYSPPQAVSLAAWAKNNNVVLFEEPVKGDFKQIAQFRKKSGMLVMLDENIQTLENLDRAIKSKCLDVLNIKLSRLGGITAAGKYIDCCQRAGIKIYLGCSEELEVGTKAIFALTKSVKDLYEIEGFGRERINPELGFSYTPGKDSRQLFLAREFLGVWKTRYENLFAAAGNLTRF